MKIIVWDDSIVIETDSTVYTYICISNIDYSNFSFESTGEMFTYREKYFISGSHRFDFYFHSLLFAGRGGGGRGKGRGSSRCFVRSLLVIYRLFKGELGFFNGL